MVDGSADLSANFTLNQLTSDLSANITIRNVKQSLEYKPYGSTDLSANFTIGQNYADLSANFTLNQQIADLSANVTIRNMLVYFQHVISSPTGSQFLTPQTLENYIIRQANRDTIATIDVKYSNAGDRFSWVTPASLLQVFAGSNVNNKTKIFGGKVKEPEWIGEEIIFHGQGHGEELIRRKITGAFYDIEASDLIKYKLLDLTTGIDTSQFSFVGEETTRTSFHADSYADESNIESTSNVGLSGGTWTLDREDFTDGFEGDTTGQNPSKWVVTETGTGNAEVSTTQAADGTKSCMLTDSDDPDYAQISYTTFLAVMGAGYIEFKVYVDDATQAIYCEIEESDNSDILIIEFNQSQKINYYNSTWGDGATEIQSYLNDTWYTVRVHYDTDGDTFSIDINGEEKVASTGFTNAPANVKRIKLYCGNMQTGTAYIDSVTWTDAGAYYTTGHIICNNMTTVSEASTDTQDYFDDATITITGTTPTGTSLTIKACNDNGTTYETFTDAVEGTFTDHHSSATNHGRVFKYKIEFTSDGSDTPTLSQIDIDVKTKAIKVYDRIEYDNEVLFDAIKDVLYDASLEGYVDPGGIYRLDYVKSKTTTDFIPYIRQGYEILKIPEWKKDGRNLVNSIKGIGAAEGTLSKAEEDQWTEQHASSWTATTLTISNEGGVQYVQEGAYCIRLNIPTGGSGWMDNCDDGTVNATYWDTSGDVTEHDGYIDIDHPQYNPSALCFDKTNYSLTGDYEISFKTYVGYAAGYGNLFLFDKEANLPIVDKDLGDFQSYNRPFLYFSGSGSSQSFYLWNNGGWVLLKSGVSVPNWFTIRISRATTTVTIWLDGDQQWSGTLTEGAGAHDNIQLGYMDHALARATLIDDVLYDYEASGGDALSPAFSKNLDFHENLKCWYRQDGYAAFDLRLETNASNYFYRSLTPQKYNEAYELKLPVGSKAAGWSETGSPDWTDITHIRFVYAADIFISVMFLDKLYFTIEPVETTYNDTDSQETSGIYEGKRYVNKQITSIEELEDRLKAIVSGRTIINEPLELIVYGRRDINTGDLIKVYCPRAGINDVVFRVDSVEYCLGTMTFNRLFCRDIRTVDLSTRIYQLDRETRQIK